MASKFRGIGASADILSLRAKRPTGYKIGRLQGACPALGSQAPRGGMEAAKSHTLAAFSMPLISNPVSLASDPIPNQAILYVSYIDAVLVILYIRVPLGLPAVSRGWKRAVLKRRQNGAPVHDRGSAEPLFRGD